MRKINSHFWQLLDVSFGGLVLTVTKGENFFIFFHFCLDFPLLTFFLQQAEFRSSPRLGSPYESEVANHRWKGFFYSMSLNFYLPSPDIVKGILSRMNLSLPNYLKYLAHIHVDINIVTIYLVAGSPRSEYSERFSGD